MKKQIALLILLTIGALHAFCQSDSLSEKESLSIICSGKWYIEFMDLDGEKEYLKIEETEWALFRENGDFEYSDVGDLVKGIWTYNHNEGYIETNDRDGIAKWKILTINKDKLVIKNTDSMGTWIMGLYKPKNI